MIPFAPSFILLVASFSNDAIAPERMATFRGRWEEAKEATRVPGLAIVGVKDGKVAFTECLGVRRPDADAPIDGDTYFYIASITKTYVATAMAILAEENALALTDPVKQHVSRFELADPTATKTITIEDLLCHRPGLAFFPIVFRDAYTGQIDDTSYFELLSYVRPGAQPEYTNVHFTLAGRVLEAVAADGRYGQWRDVLKQRLFDPLGMSRTTGYASIAWGDPNVAFPTEGTTTGSVVLPHKSDRTMHAAGGLCTTANDAAKYLLFHLGDGTANGTKLLAPDRLRDMRALRTKVPRQDHFPHIWVDGFGLGWQVGEFRGQKMYVHGGGYAGTAAFYAILPDANVGAAVLLNRASTSTAALAFSDALDLLLGNEPEARTLDAVRRAGRGAEWPAVSAAPRNPAKVEGALSLAPEQYVGSYVDDRFGDLRIDLVAGELRLTLGDYDCALDTTGLDRFQACFGPLERFAGRFELSDDGSLVEYVAFTPTSGSSMLFERE